MERPYRFGRSGDIYEVGISLPFAARGDVHLSKKGDELVVEIGTPAPHRLADE